MHREKITPWKYKIQQFCLTEMFDKFIPLLLLALLLYEGNINLAVSAIAAPQKQRRETG